MHWAYEEVFQVVARNLYKLLETNRRPDSSINRHEATGTTHYERGSPVGICNARFSFRGSDVSCRSTVYRISINEQCVYTGCRKDCRNAALRSLDFTNSPASRACFWPSGSWANRLLVRQVVMSVKFGGQAHRVRKRQRRHRGQTGASNCGLQRPAPWTVSGRRRPNR